MVPGCNASRHSALSYEHAGKIEAQLKAEVAELMAKAEAADILRNCQQNIKVSEDCSAAFAALARALGVSKAALFEDMVAERLATAEWQGLRLKIR